MIAGIIAWAVGDELVIAHPTDELPAAEVVVLVVRACDLSSATCSSACGWPGRCPGSAWPARSRVWRSAGSARLRRASSLSGLLVAVVVGVIVAERIAEARRRKRGEPSPRELLETEAASGYAPR